MCGWLQFDVGGHALAQRYDVTSLRASASAKDPRVGSTMLAFMAAPEPAGSAARRDQPLASRATRSSRLR